MTVPERGVVYVVMSPTQSPFGIAGWLLADTGAVLWAHISSSESWLRGDLTDNFPHRRVELEDRYPSGYDVAMAREECDIPADVLERNKAWGEAQRTAEEAAER